MGTTFRFSELRALHAKGFTLVWLKQNSKAPLQSGWTKAPRQDFDTFKKEYQKGMNVGVRLGNISQLEGGGVLAVLDLDVKGTKPEHQAQAREKLFELFPEVKTAPCVISGRGNGSAHYYVKIEKSVSGNERKGQSTEIVKVKMPSVQPSKKEQDTLTPQELALGLRLRPAWEISLMCEGRQVVLPGSVHPDSGRCYAWADGAGLDVLDMPTIDPGSALAKPTAAPQAALAPIEFTDVKVESLGLRPDQVAAIVDGAGVTDRSASVFAMTMAMLQRGVSEADILSVFTDQRNFLGQTAFDHAKTQNRIAAAHWLLKYTIPRAKTQTQASAFAHEVKEEPGQPIPKTNNAEIKEISGRGAEAYREAGEWKFELDLQAGPKGCAPILRPTVKNIRLILQNTIGSDFLRFDDFAQRQFWAYDVPWGPKEGDQRSSGTQDEIKLKIYLIDLWGIEASVNQFTESL